MADEKKTEETKEEVKVPAKFKSIVEEIEKMSVLDLSELVSILEDKFGVSAAAPVAMAAAPAAGDGEAAEEKTSFTVELTSTGDNKIGVIKAIRAITQIGLKEAKDMADGAPIAIKEGVSKEESEEMKKQLEEAGGSVTLK
ncbi:50S ribosomal protein L7/L12 [Candidatus Parcubacteria bacterium]|jgi:large subunit ribosomal protein L7/L12|nr:50S ribosomal protein L7/L12 [Candidatus Parcubacteria bacterium]MBT7228130.1 50S ribosomal protein L7/L12 [Candidatus Parcubacteria bacterium]